MIIGWSWDAFSSEISLGSFRVVLLVCLDADAISLMPNRIQTSNASSRSAVVRPKFPQT